MKKRLFPVLAMIIAMVFLFGACSAAPAPAQSSGETNPAPAQPAGNDNTKFDEEIAKGPNGETATRASEVNLTPEEYSKIKEGKYKAALLWAGAGEWYNALTTGAKEEFEKLGIEVVAISDAQFDPAKQATDIETALALKPDIILSLPVDPVSGERAYKPAVDNDVKIVFADNGVSGYKAGEQYVSIVTGDHFGMGRAAADLMSEAIGGKGEVGFIFHDADYFVTNNRDGEFKRTIEKKYPDIKITAEAGFTQENATGEVASSLLTQHPNIKGIYVAWDVAAEPVVAELRAAGRKDVKVITHDLGGNNDLDIAQGGNVYAKVADMPVEIGRTMAKLAAYKILGKDAPPFVVSGLVKMTKSNIAEAWEQSLNKKPADNILEALEKK
ncbi:MAG: substrate-binding domain-containing protein [Clostridia bacterium]